MTSQNWNTAQDQDRNTLQKEEKILSHYQFAEKMYLLLYSIETLFLHGVNFSLLLLISNILNWDSSLDFSDEYGSNWV